MGCASRRNRSSASSASQRADQRHVGVAAHDALVALLVDLDAVAAAVLGGLAGDLGRGERVRKRMLALGHARNAEARRHVDRVPARHEIESFEPVTKVLSDALRDVERGVADEQREAVARDARGEHPRRQRAADGVRDAHDHLVAHVHAEVLVQHVQAIDVDVDDAVVALQRLGRQQVLRALLERGTRQQPGRRVIGVHQDVRHATCEQLDQPHLAEVEVHRARLLEQREDAEHALRAVHHRAGQDLVRQRADLVGRARVVRGHRLPVQLRPGQQLAVRFRERLGARAWRGALAGAAHRDVLVRDQQRADAAAEVIHAALQQLREVVRRLAARVIALRGTEQQLEVAVTGHQAALQVADAVLRGELAGQAFERRAQQAVHQRKGPRFATLRGFARDDADRAEQRQVRAAQHEYVRRVVAIDGLGKALAVRLLGDLLRERLLDQAMQLGRIDAVVQPDRQAHAIVDRNGLGPGQQHLDQLPVRVERSSTDRRWRVAQHLEWLHVRSFRVLRPVPLGHKSSLNHAPRILDAPLSLDGEVDPRQWRIDPD